MFYSSALRQRGVSICCAYDSVLKAIETNTLCVTLQLNHCESRCLG